MNRYFIIAICFLVALIVGFFLILPKYRVFERLQADIKVKSAELKYKEDYFADIASTSEKLKDYQEVFAKIDSALPTNPSYPSLFNFLEEKSSENGLVLKKIKNLPTPPKIKSEGGEESPTEVKEIRADLSLLGSYSAFKNFLLGLQKSSRIIEAQTISIAPPGAKEKEETGGDLLIFSLTIKTYSY